MTLTLARYFPCAVRLPWESRARPQQYVLICRGGDREGLHLFDQPSEEPQTTLPVDWARTVIPSAWEARTGYQVWHPDDTFTVLAPGQGCNCGMLGRWAGPAWGHTVSAG